MLSLSVRHVTLTDDLVENVYVDEWDGGSLAKHVASLAEWLADPYRGVDGAEITLRLWQSS